MTFKELVLKAKFKRRMHGNVPVLELVGDLVDNDVKMFELRLREIYEQEADSVIIDISKTDFMDSYGLGTLVYYHNKFLHDSRQMVIMNKNPDSRGFMIQLFEVTKLNTVLSVVTSEDELERGRA
ncbi:MAG: STAS domain-containing protein [Chitinivibrionales bacterium]|nr:STAS domain-containing protein [Chitinivibrionales bacterium]